MKPVATCLALALAWAFGACHPGEPASGRIVVERDTLGDTVVVRTRLPDDKGRFVRLREDLRIGRLDGNGPDVFGHIECVAVDARGGILIFDSQAPALRYFARDGRYVRTFGGQGQGPGEYGNASGGVAVTRSGQVLLRDVANMRIDVYGPQGDVVGEISGITPMMSPGRHMLALDTLDQVYTLTPMVPFGPGHHGPIPLGFEVRRLDGTLVDTVGPPPTPTAHPTWEVRPDGSVVVGNKDAYGFEVHRPGEVIRVTMPFARVPYSDAELDRLGPALARVRDADAGKGGNAPPQLKPTYVTFDFGPEGRIWAQRAMATPAHAEVPANPVTSPAAFDVFEPDGSYLGSVRFPDDARPLAFTRTEVYAVATGKYDEEYLVRYGIEGLDGPSG